MAIEISQNLGHYITIPLEYLPRDRPLPYPVFIVIDGKIILFRQAQETITAARVKSLEEKGVVSLQVPRNHLKNYMSEVEKEIANLNESQKDEASSISVKNLIFAYTRFFEDSQDVDADVLKKLQTMTYRLAGAIKNDVALAGKLLRRYRDPMLFFANHALNTCIFSTAIGIKHGLSGSELNQLAFAGCVANVGLMKVQKEVLYKPAALTTEEWKQIQRHPAEGAALLGLLLVPPAVSQDRKSVV